MNPHVKVLCMQQYVEALAFYQSNGFQISGNQAGRFLGVKFDNFVLLRDSV
jgi:hypothetical protein